MAGAAVTAGGAPQAAEPASPLDLLTRAGFFDWAVVGLSCLFAAAAYFDAWTYVNNPAGKSVLEPWQDAALHLAWFLFTAYLSSVLFINLRRGRPLTRSLPAGHGWSMMGCVGFPIFVLLDRWAQQLLGAEYGLSALFSPPRVGEIACGGLMIVGTLRSQWRRTDAHAPAGPLAVVGAALLLSLLTFATQFAHPYRDPWAAGTTGPTGVLGWVAQDLGAASLVLQGMILTGVFLLLVRRFAIRPGSFTLISLFSGLLVATLKERWEMILVAAATGVAADLLYIWLKPESQQAYRFRAFAFLVPAVFASLFFITIDELHGIWWPSAAWSGAIFITGLGGLMVSYVAFAPAPKSARVEAPETLRPAHFPELTPDSVKSAFEALADKRLLTTSPLCKLPYLGRDGGDPVAELDGLLRDVARELAASREIVDAQAGQLLVEYYIKRSGTHEQISERLHLTKAVYYRRQNRGFKEVAARLDEQMTFTEE
jgi:hypothetical protein